MTRGYQTFCYELRGGKRQRLNIELGVGDRLRVHVLKKQYSIHILEQMNASATQNWLASPAVAVANARLGETAMPRTSSPLIPTGKDVTIAHSILSLLFRPV